MQLALGTVQMGLPYGNNAQGQLMSELEAHQILQLAIDEKISFFDTAVAYGCSEERLGSFNLHKKCPNAIISTKIPVAPKSLWSNPTQYWNWVTDHIRSSNIRLKRDHHDLLQFHQCDIEFLTNPSISLTFQRLLDENFCERIGVSVYTLDQGLIALDIPQITTIQVPVNLIDHRFISGEFLQRSRSKSVSLIARSLFLQGVLIESAWIPPVKQREKLEKLKNMAIKASNEVPLQLLALQFISQNCKSFIDYGLLGIDSIDSLRQNLALFKEITEPMTSEAQLRFKEVAEYAAHHKLIDPSTWNI
jgi:aryl-alcohol dehydrogenase-like predicted oxidoreductase